jgi:hypothetical protein
VKSKFGGGNEQKMALLLFLLSSASADSVPSLSLSLFGSGSGLSSGLSSELSSGLSSCLLVSLLSWLRRFSVLVILIFKRVIENKSVVEMWHHAPKNAFYCALVLQQNLLITIPVITKFQ